MLVRKTVATLFCGGVVLAASALKLVAPEDPHVLGVAREQTYDAQQNPLGVPKLLSQNGVQEGVAEGDFNVDSEPEAPSFKTAENRTIYQILSDSPNFSRLVRIINISNETVSLLNDTAAGITFFAPNNKALRRPHHRKRRHGHGLLSFALSDPAAIPSDVYSSLDLSEIISGIEELEASLVDDDDPDKERRKNFIRILVRAILAYHILPHGLGGPQLIQNTTFATNLTISDGALDKEPLRIRVGASKLLPAIKINFLVTVVKPDIGAKNGIIHVINHPLLPPPSIFREIFLFPNHFGSVASALQRVGLTDALEWRYVPGDDDKKWTVEGTASTTFFVPSNIAFKRLPKRLQLFLFSPFGERVLKKLLEYHIVPGIVLHTDYLYNATSGKAVTIDTWLDNSGMEGDWSDERMVAQSDIFYREGHPTPSDDFDNKQPLVPEYYYDCERPRSSWEPCGPPCRHHFPPLPPPCWEHLHTLPLSSRDSCEPHNIGGYATGHGSFPPSHMPPVSSLDLVFAANLTLPTMLTNHSLHVLIAKRKLHLPVPGHPKDIYSSYLAVNHQKVALADGVARNGAVHVIHRVLNPRPHPHHPHKTKVTNEADDETYDESNDDGWDDWEDWLPQWAAEN